MNFCAYVTVFSYNQNSRHISIHFAYLILWDVNDMSLSHIAGVIHFRVYLVSDAPKNIGSSRDMAICQNVSMISVLMMLK